MSELKHIRIEYHGGPIYNTKIIDIETGNAIQDVYRVDCTLNSNDRGPALATLYVYNMSKMPVIIDEMDVEAEVEKLKKCCPQRGQEVSDAAN